MANSIVLNGTKTHEICPVCSENILIEHGCDERGSTPLHLEHCPTCGDSIVIVAYDCPNCKPNLNFTLAESHDQSQQDQA